jgi:hypothetical protein
MLDRAAQDLLQVSFFDRGKTSGLCPAPLSHDMIALLLISAAEQVVDQLVIDLGHYMPTRVRRARAVDVTQLSFCVRGYHVRAYAFDLLQQAPSTTLADLFEVSSEGSPAMGTSIGRRASENGEHGAADRG